MSQNLHSCDQQFADTYLKRLEIRAYIEILSKTNISFFVTSCSHTNTVNTYFIMSSSDSFLLRQTCEMVARDNCKSKHCPMFSIFSAKKKRGCSHLNVKQYFVLKKRDIAALSLFVISNVICLHHNFPFPMFKTFLML